MAGRLATKSESIARSRGVFLSLLGLVLGQPEQHFNRPSCFPVHPRATGRGRRSTLSHRFGRRAGRQPVPDRRPFRQWPAAFPQVVRRLDPRAALVHAAGRCGVGEGSPEGSSRPKMVSPQARREAVTVLMTERDFGVTRACGLVHISRSLYRYRSRRPDCSGVRARIEEIAAVKRRYGYRRINVLLRCSSRCGSRRLTQPWPPSPLLSSWSSSMRVPMVPQSCASPGPMSPPRGGVANTAGNAGGIITQPLVGFLTKRRRVGRRIHHRDCVRVGGGSSLAPDRPGTLRRGRLAGGPLRTTLSGEQPAWR